ncbi:MAG: hypothetical protein ACP5O7_12405 [Phycisphaerae bacterium]
MIERTIAVGVEKVGGERQRLTHPGYEPDIFNPGAANSHAGGLFEIKSRQSGAGKAIAQNQRYIAQFKLACVTATPAPSQTPGARGTIPVPDLLSLGTWRISYSSPLPGVILYTVDFDLRHMATAQWLHAFQPSPMLLQLGTQGLQGGLPGAPGQNPGGGPQQADIPDSNDGVDGETIEAAPSNMPPAGEGGDGWGYDWGGGSEQAEQEELQLEDAIP